jgi:hypothetical protein
MTRVKSFIYEREHFVLNSLITFEPVKIFMNGRFKMKLRSFGESTSSGI